MRANPEQNTRIFEFITMVAIGLFLVFIFIKFLY
jgi:hypothetical protein